MKRFIKFSHTTGAIGLMGSLMCLIVLEYLTPPLGSLDSYAHFRSAMAAIATWVFLPSFALTLVPGLLAMALTPAYLNAGWAWIKAATGILIFAGGLHVLAPIQDKAQQSAQAARGQLDPAMLTNDTVTDAAAMWVLLIISIANVVLGIWRQRIMR